MAYKKEIFHLYETEENFLAHMEAGLISPDSICFLAETQRIYTQYAYYSIGEKDFKSLKSTVSEMQEVLDRLPEVVQDIVDDAVRAIQEALATLDSRVTDNEAAVSAVQGEVTEMKGTMVQLSQYFMEVKDNFDTRIGALESSMTTVANTLNSHNERIDANAEAAANAQTDIDTYKIEHNALLGAANGIATLDGTGKVPAEQLPEGQVSIVEAASKSEFPAEGDSGVIYIAKDTNLTYRWGGSVYVEVSPSIALGETSTTAYAGDKGKRTADSLTSHVTNYSNPHKVTKSQVGLGNVDNTSDINKPVSNATQAALALKADKTEIPQIGIANAIKPGLVLSGTDIEVDTAGNVSVKDDSHKHTKITDISTSLSLSESIADNTEFVSSALSGSTGGNVTSYRSKGIAIWNYVKGKIADVLGLTASDYNGTAAKATADADGNVITETYQTIADEKFNWDAHVNFGRGENYIKLLTVQPGYAVQLLISPKIPYLSWRPEIVYIAPGLYPTVQGDTTKPYYTAAYGQQPVTLLYQQDPPGQDVFTSGVDIKVLKVMMKDVDFTGDISDVVTFYTGAEIVPGGSSSVKIGTSIQSTLGSNTLNITHLQDKSRKIDISLTGVRGTKVTQKTSDDGVHSFEIEAAGYQVPLNCFCIRLADLRDYVTEHSTEYGNLLLTIPEGYNFVYVMPDNGDITSADSSGNPGPGQETRRWLGNGRYITAFQVGEGEMADGTVLKVGGCIPIRPYRNDCGGLEIENPDTPQEADPYHSYDWFYNNEFKGKMIGCYYGSGIPRINSEARFSYREFVYFKGWWYTTIY